MFLDGIEPESVMVGHGILGIRGSMGYGMPLAINGMFHEHAISAHPPSRLQFALQGEHEHFAAHVALNDTSSDSARADFLVYADGILVAYAPHVGKGDRPRKIAANLNGARMLELVVETDDATFNHAVWVDPVLQAEPERLLVSVANRLKLLLPAKAPICKRCIGVIADANATEMLDNFLGSLHLNGNVRDAQIFILTNTGDNRAVAAIARKYQAQIVEYRSAFPENIWLKNALYSLPQAVIADQYLYMDVDMVVVQPIDQIFKMLDVCHPNSVLMARDAFSPPGLPLGRLLCEDVRPYFGRPEHRQLLRLADQEMQYPLVVNGGVIAGNRKGMLAVENVMKAMSPEAGIWLDENPMASWREQAILNLAVARLNNGVELDYRYNCQLLSVPAEISKQNGRFHATHNSQSMHVLHFNGDAGRARYAEVKDAFLRVAGTLQHGMHAGEALAEIEQQIARYTKSMRRQIDSSSVHRLEAVDGMNWPLRVLYHHLCKDRPETLLDIDTIEGIFAYMACSWAVKNQCLVVRMDESSTPLLLSQMEGAQKQALGTLKGDPFVLCKEMAQTKERFDAVILDTRRNEKNTAMLVLASRKLLTPGGKIFLHDVDNPLCNTILLKANLQSEGFTIHEEEAFRPSFAQQRLYCVEPDST